MLPRFLLYGCAGWVLEVCFTGTSAAIFQKDAHGTAKTYLWMHPIYGATALGMEFLHDRLRFLPRPIRALAYTAVIFGAEFATGWLLRRALGRCPWDYREQGWSVKGLVRLDYFPFWYGTALAFEPAREALLRITSEALRQTPEFRHAVAEGEVQPLACQGSVEVEAGATGETFQEALKAESQAGKVFPG
ncbi:putative ABC transporter permease [Hyalangium versicolor]|uniref:putative ABC transporter permease n=1 Tax=Hyalangium versicolor TaxID=2861190 RepID=UPI001CCF28BF|nr:putative ABC transporter permease [Hyalangium versicolor]